MSVRAHQRVIAIMLLSVVIAACGPVFTDDPQPDPASGIEGASQAAGEPTVAGGDGQPAAPDAGAPGGDQAGAPPPGAPPEGDAATSPSQPGQPPAPDGGQPPGSAGQAQPPPQPAPAPQPAAAPATSLDSPLGGLCRAYLQGSVPRLHVEIDSQDGATLPGSVVAHLEATLRRVLDKPGGITVDTTGTVPGGAEPWTPDRLRQLAIQTRTTLPDEQTAVMHVLALRGEPDQSSDIADAIGVAFAGGEMALFVDRVDGLAVLLGGAEAILQAVAVHEAGHLLCLVNIGYTSDIDHEDPDHPGHSRNRDSVMFHAIETTAISQVFSGPPPRDFDADDLADLAAWRAGRY